MDCRLVAFWFVGKARVLFIDVMKVAVHNHVNLLHILISIFIDLA